MGQAKLRGTREERILQSQAKTQALYDRQCAAKIAYWEARSEEEKHIIMDDNRRAKEAYALLMQYATILKKGR